MSTYFKDCWLEDPLLSSWLEKGPDKKSAKCKKCHVFHTIEHGQKVSGKPYVREKAHHQV